MIFKTLNGDLTVFNKTLISTKDHLKSLQAVNATVYNKNGAFNLQGLLVNSSQSVSTYTKLNNAFKAYNGNLSKSTQLQNAYVQAVGKQNVTLGNYLAGLNGAKASMGGYVKSLVAAKAASIGLQAASIALNTAISMGITLAISALISAITKWVNKEKEAREEAIENAKAAKEEANNLSELLNKYNQLSKEVKSNQGVKEDLLSVQSDLLEALGIEASQIDTLIEKYGDLNSAINQITLDSLRDVQGDLMVAIDAYEKDLIKVGKGYAHWYSLFDRNLLSTGQSSTDALDILEKAGIISSGSHGEGGGALVLTGNDKTVEGILENYQKLKDAQEALNTAIDNGEITMEEMIKIPLYNDINSRLEELEESIGNYNTAIADLNKNMAQQQILKSLAEQSSIPETKEEFEAFQQSMIDTAIASTKFKGSQDDIRDSIINVLSVMPEFKKYFEELNDVQSSTSNIENPISPMADIISNLDDIEEGLSSVNDLYKEFKDKEKEGFSNEKLASFIETFKEIEGINVDNFLNTLTSSSSTAQEVQEAFNSLATEYIDSTNILDKVTESNEGYIAAKLKEIGITNAVELVEAQLITQRHNAELSTIDVKNATYGEIAALRDEISVTEEAKLAINKYYLEKISSNGISLSTSGDIENIMSLVKACGSGIAALKAFYEAKQGLQSAFNNTLSQNNWKASTVIGQEEARKKLEAQFAEYKENEKRLIENAEAEIDAALNKKYAVGSNYGGNASNSNGSKSSQGGSGGSGSGSKKKEKKDAEEVYDWIETLIKRTDEKIEALQKKATDAKGWRAKNALQDTVFDELQEKLVQLQADYGRYMQEANSVGLSDIYINKIQNGELDIERLESTEENEAIKEKIKEYQTW